MSGGWGDHCIATFKNQQMVKSINKYLVTEIEEEEWLITSEDEDFINLGKPDNNDEYGSYYSINKAEFNKDNVRNGNVYVEIHKRTFIDLAKLFGQRNVCMGQKGDKRLTKKEARKIVRTFEYGKHYFPVQKGKMTEHDEKYIRLLSAYIRTNEKGYTTISFDSFCSGEALAVLRALSSKFPKTKITLEEEHEYWDREEYSLSRDTYVVKNGKSEHVDSVSEYEDYTDYDESNGEED